MLLLRLENKQNMLFLPTKPYVQKSVLTGIFLHRLFSTKTASFLMILLHVGSSNQKCCHGWWRDAAGAPQSLHHGCRDTVPPPLGKRHETSTHCFRAPVKTPTPEVYLNSGKFILIPGKFILIPGKFILIPGSLS